jgi:hypothetical protein
VTLLQKDARNCSILFRKLLLLPRPTPSLPHLLQSAKEPRSGVVGLAEAAGAVAPNISDASSQLQYSTTTSSLLRAFPISYAGDLYKYAADVIDASPASSSPVEEVPPPFLLVPPFFVALPHPSPPTQTAAGTPSAARCSSSAAALDLF